MSLQFIKKQETKSWILWPKNKHFVPPGMLHDMQDICMKLSDKTWDLREMCLLALYKLCNEKNTYNVFLFTLDLTWAVGTDNGFLQGGRMLESPGHQR